MNSIVRSKILNVEITKPKIHFIPSIIYSRLESKPKFLFMDILQPQVNRRMPCVIFVTGGGFEVANRARMPQLRFRLAAEGFVVSSINYRVLPDGKFPKPLIDVKSAIRFVKAHARELKVDPEKICLIGDSAGGYLVAFAAVTQDSPEFNIGEHLNKSSRVTAAVDLYGISDPALYENVHFENFIEGGDVQKLDVTSYVTKDSAPILLMHGMKDNVVPPIHSEIFFKVLNYHKVESELILIPNANHSDEYWVQDSVFDVIVNFLNKYTR